MQKCCSVKGPRTPTPGLARDRDACYSYSCDRIRDGLQSYISSRPPYTLNLPSLRSSPVLVVRCVLFHNIRLMGLLARTLPGRVHFPLRVTCNPMYSHCAVCSYSRLATAFGVSVRATVPARLCCVATGMARDRDACYMLFVRCSIRDGLQSYISSRPPYTLHLPSRTLHLPSLRSSPVLVRCVPFHNIRLIGLPARRRAGRVHCPPPVMCNLLY